VRPPWHGVMGADMSYTFPIDHIKLIFGCDMILSSGRHTVALGTSFPAKVPTVSVCKRLYTVLTVFISIQFVSGVKQFTNRLYTV
jgi:hypothetical protein